MANSGTYPPNFDTDVGLVRLLTSDTEPTILHGLDGAPDQYFYLWAGDTEIQAYIRVTGSPQSAALRILRLVAMTPAMQYKKWSSADLSVDGAAISRALRELINDIEKSLNGDDEKASSEYFNLVSTGTSMGQPAFFQTLSYGGVEIDTTIAII